MKTLNAIKHDLSWAIGSEKAFHQPLTRNFNYTEGMKEYFTLAQAWWLHDIFGTEVYSAVVKKDPDTYYAKIVVEGSKAVITCRDYKDNVFYTRKINFTTHPEGEMDFHIGFLDDIQLIICLPSES